MVVVDTGRARTTFSFRKPAVLYPHKSEEACRGFLYHFTTAKYSIKRWLHYTAGLDRVFERGAGGGGGGVGGLRGKS